MYVSSSFWMQWIQTFCLFEINGVQIFICSTKNTYGLDCFWFRNRVFQWRQGHGVFVSVTKCTVQRVSASGVSPRFCPMIWLHFWLPQSDFAIQYERHCWFNHFLCHIMFVIIGATGQVGRNVAQCLLEKQQPVRIIVCNPGKAKKLSELGAMIHVGDIDSPSDVQNGFKGADVVFLLDPPAYHEPNVEEITRLRLDTLKAAIVQTVSKK